MNCGNSSHCVWPMQALHSQIGCVVGFLVINLSQLLSILPGQLVRDYNFLAASFPWLCLPVLCPHPVSPIPTKHPGLPTPKPFSSGIFSCSPGPLWTRPLFSPSPFQAWCASLYLFHSLPSASSAFHHVSYKAPHLGAYLTEFTHLSTSAYKTLQWSSPMRDTEKYHFSCPTDQSGLEIHFFHSVVTVFSDGHFSKLFDCKLTAYKALAWPLLKSRAKSPTHTHIKTGT